MLAIQNVQFGYDDQHQDLVSVAHFLMSPGEKVLLHGPSGCGKSTLLSLIAGIRPLRHGSIHMLGRSFSSLSQRQRDQFRANHIGVIFQAFNLLPYLSATDNVCLAANFSKHRQQREKTGNASQIRQRAQSLLVSLGLDVSVIGKPAWQLSFGQQQRVAAARALFGKPALIIADEPTSSLDDNSRDNLMHLLCQQCDNSGSSLLMVSHDLSLSHHFDRSLAFSELNAGINTEPGAGVPHAV